MSTNTIQSHYHDALFFASSPQHPEFKLKVKDRKHYLSPTDFKVIIKLISYCSKDGFTTYQNKDIAKHLFLAERTVKDSVESLLRMGYINTKRDIYHNTNTWASKRTIYINWDFIQNVLDMIPSQDELMVRPIESIPKTVAPGLNEKVSKEVEKEYFKRMNEKYNIKTIHGNQ